MWKDLLVYIGKLLNKYILLLAEMDESFMLPSLTLSQQTMVLCIATKMCKGKVSYFDKVWDTVAAGHSGGLFPSCTSFSPIYWLAAEMKDGHWEPQFARGWALSPITSFCWILGHYFKWLIKKGNSWSSEKAAWKTF